MKKLFLIVFLAVGTSSFASSGKVVNNIKVKTTFKKCTVGGYSADTCAKAREMYCENNPCTNATLSQC
jgi:hypothetical protein